MGRRFSIIWTDEMLSYLRDNYSTMLYEDMARVLGVSATTVQQKCKEIGCLRKKIYNASREWSDEELEYLRVHFPDEAAIDISDHLGINYTEVLKKSKELGLKKSDGYSKMGYYRRYVRNYKNIV